MEYSGKWTFLLVVVVCSFLGCGKAPSEATPITREALINKLKELQQFEFEDVGHSFESSESRTIRDDFFGVSGRWSSIEGGWSSEILLQFSKVGEFWKLDSVGVEDVDGLSGEEREEILQQIGSILGQNGY